MNRPGIVPNNGIAFQQFRLRRFLGIGGSTIVIVIVASIVVTTLTLILTRGNENALSTPSTNSPPMQTEQDGLSISLNGVYYSDGDNIDLVNTDNIVQCSYVSGNPINDIIYNGGTISGDVPNYSTEITANSADYLHTISTTFRLENGPNIGTFLSCSTSSSSIAIFVTFQGQSMPPPAIAESIFLTINDTPAPNGGRITVPADRNVLRCVVISSQPDITIDWKLDGIMTIGEPERIDQRQNDDEFVLYESTYSVVITRNQDMSFIGCSALTSTGATLINAMTRVDFQEIQLGITVDSVTYNTGQDVVLNEGSHTFTCGTLPIMVEWTIGGGLVSQNQAFTRVFTSNDCGTTVRCDPPDGYASSQVTVKIKRQPTSAAITIAPESSEAASIIADTA